MIDRIILTGEEIPLKDNYGNPRQQYYDRIAVMTDEELYKETRQMIWLSAYANNNPRSDYHWQKRATYEEWIRRKRTDEYDRALADEYAANFG